VSDQIELNCSPAVDLPSAGIDDVNPIPFLFDRSADVRGHFDARNPSANDDNGSLMRGGNGTFGMDFSRNRHGLERGVLLANSHGGTDFLYDRQHGRQLVWSSFSTCRVADRKEVSAAVVLASRRRAQGRRI